MSCGRSSANIFTTNTLSKLKTGWKVCLASLHNFLLVLCCSFHTMKTKTKPKIKIQLVIFEEINSLIDKLAEKERRTRSAIVELALLSYANGR
jgi:hypothetical protein